MGLPHLEPTRQAIGKVCVEHVIPYPPGIPVLTVGEIVREEHVVYIEAAQANSQIEMMTSKLGHILVAD
jgi:arginine/lysine/ornithine decarboxylase